MCACAPPPPPPPLRPPPANYHYHPPFPRPCILVFPSSAHPGALLTDLVFGSQSSLKRRPHVPRPPPTHPPTQPPSPGRVSVTPGQWATERSLCTRCEDDYFLFWYRYHSDGKPERSLCLPCLEGCLDDCAHDRREYRIGCTQCAPVYICHVRGLNMCSDTSTHAYGSYCSYNVYAIPY